MSDRHTLLIESNQRGIEKLSLSGYWRLTASLVSRLNPQALCTNAPLLVSIKGVMFGHGYARYGRAIGRPKQCGKAHVPHNAYCTYCHNTTTFIDIQLAPALKQSVDRINPLRFGRYTYSSPRDRLISYEGNQGVCTTQNL
jgi:hypothetical protein